MPSACNHQKLSWFPCHRRKDRSFHIKGIQFPICARCTSILLGYVLTPLAIILHWKVMLLWIAIMCLPMPIDGYTQLWGWRQSSNALRFVTGLSFGVGQALFISTVIEMFVNVTLK